MVFKDAVITPGEMPRTTPVPKQHGRPYPLGIERPPAIERPPEAARAGRVSIERFAGEELDELEHDPLSDELLVIN
ncbi:MAG: hypothetical protein ACREMK_16125, partial [Gemmatimonadota bacterium]